MATPEYTCGIEAEPLHRYTPGGYHPVELGQVLEDRYLIVHKLGWGGHSTVWAARDLSALKNVALKITTADGYQKQEAAVLQHLATSAQQHPGYAHLPRLYDEFTLEGPNGLHQCLVTDIVGINVDDLVSDRLKDERLPAKLARDFARQALLALDCLHDHAIAHGDVHVRNLALTVPGLEAMPEWELMSKLNNPKRVEVVRTNGRPIPPGVPSYLVRPTSLSVDIKQATPQIKLIDFGEAFFRSQPPLTLHTPLVVRPPEAVFEDALGLEVDVWSMGCMVFELIAAQPPFDSILVTKPLLVQQMLDSTGDNLPERWKPAWQTMQADSDEVFSDDADISLQSWLQEVYFNERSVNDLKPRELKVAGRLILSMCRMEPGERVSIKQALNSEWAQGH